MASAVSARQPQVRAARGPGRPRRSSAERAARRNRLLEGAMAGIRRHGPVASLDEIAAEAGVSKPVLHGEFGGKTGLAEAIALQLTHQVEQTLFDLLSSEPDLAFDAAVRTVLDALIASITDDPVVYAYLVRTWRADDRGLLDNAFVTTLHDHIKVVLRLLAPNVDPDLLTVIAHGTYGFVFASVESWHRTGRPSRATLLDALTAVITQAFTALGALETTATNPPS